MARMGPLRFLSVVCDRLITNRSGSGNPDLQGPGAARSARACPSHAFSLKQDGQDLQDGQDVQDEPKVREDLNVYRTSEQHREKVR